MKNYFEDDPEELGDDEEDEEDPECVKEMVDIVASEDYDVEEELIVANMEPYYEVAFVGASFFSKSQVDLVAIQMCS